MTTGYYIDYPGQEKRDRKMVAVPLFGEHAGRQATTRLGIRFTVTRDVAITKRGSDLVSCARNGKTGRGVWQSLGCPSDGGVRLPVPLIGQVGQRHRLCTLIRVTGLAVFDQRQLEN